MKSRKLFVSIGIALLSVCILVSCSDKKSTQQKEIKMSQIEKDNLKKEQDKIALYIVNHYEEVKKIEFLDYYKGGFGQSDSISVMVNDSSYILPIDFEGNNENNYTIGYDPKEFYIKQRLIITDIQTLDGIEIVYYKGENK